MSLPPHVTQDVGELEHALVVYMPPAMPPAPLLSGDLPKIRNHLDDPSVTSSRIPIVSKLRLELWKTDGKAGDGFNRAPVVMMRCSLQSPQHREASFLPPRNVRASALAERLSKKVDRTSHLLPFFSSRQGREPVAIWASLSPSRPPTPFPIRHIYQRSQHITHHSENGDRLRRLARRRRSSLARNP